MAKETSSSSHFVSIWVSSMSIMMHSEGKRGCSAEPIHYAWNDVTISGDVLLASLLLVLLLMVRPVIVTTDWAGCLCYSVFLCVCLSGCLPGTGIMNHAHFPFLCNPIPRMCHAPRSFYVGVATGTPSVHPYGWSAGTHGGTQGLIDRLMDSSHSSSIKIPRFYYYRMPVMGFFKCTSCTIITF